MPLGLFSHPCNRTSFYELSSLDLRTSHKQPRGFCSLPIPTTLFLCAQDHNRCTQPLLHLILWNWLLLGRTGHLSTNFLLLIYELVTNNQEDFARYLYQQHCSCVPKIITAAHNLYSTLFYGTGFFWEELTLLVESFPYPSILYLRRQKTFFHKTQWLNMNMK